MIFSPSDSAISLLVSGDAVMISHFSGLPILSQRQISNLASMKVNPNYAPIISKMLSGVMVSNVTGSYGYLAALGAFPDRDSIELSIRAGRNLVVDDIATLSALHACSIANYAIKCHDKNSINGGRFGVSPSESFAIPNAACSNPYNVGKYFKDESRFFIYDKYINNDSVSFIEFCLDHADPCFTLDLMTTSKSRFGSLALIASRLQLSYPSATIRVHEACPATSRNMHDRNIYISDIYRINLSVGCDQFGALPNWLGRLSDVNVFPVLPGTSVGHVYGSTGGLSFNL